MIISNKEYAVFQIADYLTNDKIYCDKLRKANDLPKNTPIDIACLCGSWEDRNNLKKYFNRLCNEYCKNVKIHFIVNKEDIYGLKIMCLYISEHYRNVYVRNLMDMLDVNILKFTSEEDIAKEISLISESLSFRDKIIGERMIPYFKNPIIIYGDKWSRELI